MLSCRKKKGCLFADLHSGDMLEASLLSIASFQELHFLVPAVCVFGKSKTVSPKTVSPNNFILISHICMYIFTHVG